MDINKYKPVVLAVDDDEDARFLLKRAFEKAGIDAKLIQLEDGTDAVNYLSGEGIYSDRATYPLPDLLLLDLKMTILSGFDVLEFMRTKPQLTFPTVVFSSSANEQDIVKAYALGANSYVMKPVTFDKLIEFVNAVSGEFLIKGGEQNNRPLATLNFAQFAIPATGKQSI